MYMTDDGLATFCKKKKKKGCFLTTPLGHIVKPLTGVHVLAENNDNRIRPLPVG